MKNMIEQTLLHLGLNPTEIKVYLTLLQTGTSPASAVGKRTDMPPSTARYTCKQLVQMGIVTMGTKQNTLLFTAREPENLNILLEKEQNILKRKTDGLNKIVGDLKKLYNPHSTLPKVRFCEGVEGLISILDDTLTSKKPIYSALKLTNDIHPDVFIYLEKKYIPTRTKLRNRGFSLLNDNPMTQKYRENDQIFNRTSLMIPEEDFPFDQLMQIYGNKVAFYYSKKEGSGGVIIEDENVRNTQFSLFKMAWEFAKTLTINQACKIPPLE